MNKLVHQIVVKEPMKENCSRLRRNFSFKRNRLTLFTRLAWPAFLLASTCTGCRKLDGEFPVVIRNATGHELRGFQVVCGDEPIYFDVLPFANSNEKMLKSGGRETVAPITVTITLNQYRKDSVWMNYNLGNTANRDQLIEERTNTIEVLADTLPNAKIQFRFSIQP